LKSVTLGNGGVETYGYNSRLQLSSLDLTKSGTQLHHYDYKYGVYNSSANTVDETKNTGQIARIEGFIATTKQWQQNFAYDSLGRLSSAREFRGDNSAQSWLVNYDYDVFGNRFQYQSQNGGNPFSQVWVESGAFSQSTNRFNSGVTYDDAGNITVDSKFRNLSLQYDANNRQKQSSDGTTTVVSVYNAGGQRVATQVGGSLTNVLVYDAGGKLLAEYGASVAIGGTQYVFADHQGSPRVIIGGNGNVISRHDYAPFGEELGAIGLRTSGQGYGGGDNARQKYAGMESDDATGMDHTQWRQYDSISGRWTAPDPYGGSMSVRNPQSFNRYLYVGNDPVNMRDPSGLMEQEGQPDPDTANAKDEPPGDPFETGQSIVADAVARYDHAVADTIDALRKRASQSEHGAPELGESEHPADSDSNDEGTATISLAETTLGIPQGPGQSSGGATLHYWPAMIWRDANGNEVDSSPYGHIALQLSDGTYISYWPAEHLGAFDLGVYVYATTHTYREDYNEEHQTSSQTVKITGLDEAKIKKWWNNGKGHGKFGSGNNCADIVTAALRQGGFVPWTGNLIWSTPYDVWDGTKTTLKLRDQPLKLHVPF